MVDDLGQTVVMVTHDPGAAAYADRVVFLVDGAIVEELAEPDPGAGPRDHGPAGRLTMVRVSLRNLLVNKLRLFLTVAAVTVGVAFVSGTFVLSDTMVKAFDELYTGLTSGTDVVVKSEAAFEADITTNGGQRAPPGRGDGRRRCATSRESRWRRGGASGSRSSSTRTATPIQPGGAPTFGASVGDGPAAVGDVIFREGRAPTGADEMVIDARTAEKAGFRAW